MSQTISVIIPALNESKTIGEIISRIKKVNDSFEVLVVDDGSTDDTASVAERAGARVVRHVYNLGNGAAVKSGAKNASGEILVFMDGDGQHQPEDIPALLKDIETHSMVIGARTKKSKVSSFRTFGNWLLRSLASFLVERKIPDLTSGFRAVHKDKFMEFYHLYPTTYSYPTTITMSMLRAGYFVKFVPLDSIQARQAGQSHIRPLKDGMKFVNIMLRMCMLFNPNKIFLPIAALFLLSGAGLAVHQLIKFQGVLSSPIILLISGTFIFLFSLLAEQLSTLLRNTHVR